MMIGQSFAPLSDPNDPQQQNQPGGPVNPVQEAIKVLSLRMPRVLGGGAPAPMELLTGLGGAGTPMGTGNPLGEILKTILTGMLPQPSQSAPMGGGMPAPSAPAPAPMPQQPAPTTTMKPKIEYIPNEPEPAPMRQPRSPFGNRPNTN